MENNFTETKEFFEIFIYHPFGRRRIIQEKYIKEVSSKLELIKLIE